jgi:hypothetical protein
MMYVFSSGCTTIRSLVSLYKGLLMATEVTPGTDLAALIMELISID